MAKKPEKLQFDKNLNPKKVEKQQIGDSTIEVWETDTEVQVICTGPRARTLKDLEKNREIDNRLLDLERVKFNQWEVAMKNPDDFLKPLVVPLYQIKADYKKILLRAVQYSHWPVSVITLDGKQATVKKSRRKVKRYLIWSDSHFHFRTNEKGLLEPIHDPRALGALHTLMVQEKLDGSWHLGDLLDFPEFSDKFTTKARYRHQTQRALEEALRWLLKLNTLVVIEGNHDERLPRALEKWNQEIMGLRNVDDLANHPAMSIPQLLNLRQHKIRWIGDYPKGEGIIGDAHLFHGDVANSRPGATAKKYLSDCNHTSVYGHIHRQEIVTERRENGQVITAVCVGCTCHIDGRVSGHNPRHQDWTQGAAVLTDYGNGATSIELVPIVDGIATWRGREYSAEDGLGV